MKIDLRFHSLEDAFAFANQPLPPGQQEASREIGTWTGSASWQQFQNLALSRDWEPLRELRTQLAAIPTNRTARRSEVPGVLSVSRYLAGEPKPCTRRQRGIAKRLRIAVGMSYSSRVYSGDAILWGVTLIERLAALRTQGVETTVDVILSCTDVYHGEGGSVEGSVDVAFCVPFDDACLLLAHPSSLRRLGFAIMERASTLRVEGNYGRPSKVMPDGYDLAFNDPSRNHRDLIKSLDAAFSSVD